MINVERGTELLNENLLTVLDVSTLLSWSCVQLNTVNSVPAFCVLLSNDIVELKTVDSGDCTVLFLYEEASWSRAVEGDVCTEEADLNGRSSELLE